MFLNIGRPPIFKCGVKLALAKSRVCGPVVRREISNIPVTSAGAYARDAGVQSTHLYATKWHQQLGPIFRDPDLGAVFISDPGMAEQILAHDKYPKMFIPASWTHHSKVYGKQRGLMFKEKEDWWQARRQVNTVLARQSCLHSMYPVLDQEVNNLIQHLKLKSSTSLTDQDIYGWLVKSMMRLLIGDEGLCVDQDSVLKITDQVIEDARGIFINTAALMLLNINEAVASNRSEWVKFCEHTNRLFSLFDHLIRSAGHNLGGVAGQLLKNGMSRDEVEKIVKDLMLGGMDTSATATIWMLYTLASHKEVQEKIRQEVLNVCGSEQSSCSRTSDLHLCKGLIKESMRIYPVAPYVTRIISEPLNLDKHHLPVGSFLAISVYVMGRNPEVFPQPELPIPERWTRNENQNSSVRHIMAFSNLPFGHGVRMCVGRRLAELKMLVLVSRLMQEFYLSTDSTAHYITRMTGIPEVSPNIYLTPYQK